RRPSVVPQQALALANSELVIAQSRLLARSISQQTANNDEKFIAEAFLKILARPPKKEEIQLCLQFLNRNPNQAIALKNVAPEHSRDNLVLVLFNHNDFVTIR